MNDIFDSRYYSNSIRCASRSSTFLSYIFLFLTNSFNFSSNLFRWLNWSATSEFGSIGNSSESLNNDLEELPIEPNSEVADQFNHLNKLEVKLIENDDQEYNTLFLIRNKARFPILKWKSVKAARKFCCFFNLLISI